MRALDRDEVELLGELLWRHLERALELGVSLRRVGERGELREHGLRGLLAQLDEFRRGGEIDEGEIAQVGRDQDVRRLQRGELRAHVLLGEDVEHLRRIPHDRLQLVARHERRADVHRDDDVRAHRAHELDRQVVDEPAVAQDTTVDLHRREHARHRHARAHGLVEAPGVEDDLLARDHVGGDRAVGDRQLVEVLDVVDVARELVQEELEIAARQRALEPEEFAVAIAELERERKRRELFLAAEADVAALGTVGQQGGPAHRAELALHLVRRHAARVEAADDRAHGGAGDVVDRHAHLVQHLEHADVREAARASARQDEPHLGPRLRGVDAGGDVPSSDCALGGSERGSSRCAGRANPSAMETTAHAGTNHPRFMLAEAWKTAALRCAIIAIAPGLRCSHNERR